MLGIGKIFMIMMLLAGAAIFVASRIDARNRAREEAEDRALRSQDPPEEE